MIIEKIFLSMLYSMFACFLFPDLDMLWLHVLIKSVFSTIFLANDDFLAQFQNRIQFRISKIYICKLKSQASIALSSYFKYLIRHSIKIARSTIMISLISEIFS